MITSLNKINYLIRFKWILEYIAKVTIDRLKILTVIHNFK